MRKSVLLLLGLALSFAGPLDAQQTVAYTTSALKLRSSPSTSGATLGTLPRATRVELGTCDVSWCAVKVQGRSGFVAKRYLADSAPASAVVVTEGRGYTNSAREHVRSPTHTPGNQVPAGASAQCRDGSYSFSRSRRGTCSHHGGVSRWL